MNRRKFLKTGTALCLAGLAGCDQLEDESIPYPDARVPEFSSENLHRLLDELLEAYESKGMRVSETLLPPHSESELRERCQWFPGELSPEIISLYTWRGGQASDAWVTEFPFWFRDNSFSNLEYAEQSYKSIMATYGLFPQDRELLKYSFPFAEFNGGWYILPTRGLAPGTQLKAPVISVLEGVVIYYYSIEAMVQTCIDWVNHELYSAESSLPDTVEIEIWRKHNPGIFE